MTFIEIAAAIMILAFGALLLACAIALIVIALEK